MASSVDRVRHALAEAGVEAQIVRMDASTRTAEDAASACGCEVRQIVKSLIFKGRESGELVLLLVPGDVRVDLDAAASAVGEALDRADCKEVRAITGFAIGGVAPIGHVTPVRTLLDGRLSEHDPLWAAAGAPNAVFRTDRAMLLNLTDATLATLG